MEDMAEADIPAVAADIRAAVQRGPVEAVAGLWAALFWAAAEGTVAGGEGMDIPETRILPGVPGSRAIRAVTP